MEENCESRISKHLLERLFGVVGHPLLSIAIVDIMIRCKAFLSGDFLLGTHIGDIYPSKMGLRFVFKDGNLLKEARHLLMKTLEPYVKSDTVNSINMDGVVLPCIKSTERYRIKGLSVRSVYVEFFCMNDGYPLMEMYEEGIDKNFMWITKIIWLSCPFDSWELRPRVYINNKECIRFDV